MAYEEQENDKGSYPKNLKSKLDRSKAAKQLETRGWDLALLFLEGKQQLVWNKNNAAFDMDRRRGASERLTINLILNIYRNVTSRLAMAYPGVVVLPASPSHEDIIKAKSSEIALKYYWNSANMGSVLKTAMEWLVSTGNAFLHTYYDPDKKEVVTKAVSPYDVFFEAGAPSMEESQWCSIRHYYLKKELLASYPDKRQIIEEALETAKAPVGQAFYSDESKPPNRIEIYETYFKDGKYCIHLNDEILFKGKTPNDIVPLQMIRYTPIPNRLWGVGLITPLIELQTLYNRVRTQIVTNIELMSNPKWLIPKTSGVNPNAITNRPGEKVYYNPAGGHPQQLPSVAIPHYVLDNVQQLHSEMLDVAGVHSISLGKRAKGITAGKAIDALAQQDSSQLSITQDQIEEAVKSSATNVLLYMREYYSEPKMVRMMDNTGKVVFDSISRTNIVKDPEVFIEAGSLFRNEAQDRDQKVLDLLEKQLIPPDVALRELSFRTGNAFVVEGIGDEAHATDILRAAAQGGQVEIFKTDNLSVFNKVFGDFIKSQEYYMLEQESQDYIRNIYVALAHALNPEAVPDPIEQESKVYPPPLPKPQTAVNEPAVKAANLLQSRRAQEQQLASAAEQMAIKGQEVATMTTIKERGMENSLPGGAA